MPYLLDAQREEAEETGLRDSVNYTDGMNLKNFAGYLNYAITRHCKGYLKRNGTSYWTLCCMIGTIICAMLELYRRVVIPYENEKIKEHGDV